MNTRKSGGIKAIIDWDDYEELMLFSNTKVEAKAICICNVCGAIVLPEYSYTYEMGLCPSCARHAARLYYLNHVGSIPYELMTTEERAAKDAERSARSKPFKISQKRRNELHRRDGWKCHYCGESDPGELTLDHKIPRSRGGDDSDENLITACKKCNSRKGNKTYDEYIEWLKNKCNDSDNGA